MDPLNCKNCKTELDGTEEICVVCEFPIKGEKREQTLFLDRQVAQKCDVEEAVDKLKRSRNILFFIGAFYLVLPFTPLMPYATELEIGISVGVGVFFFVFALLTMKFPRAALLVPIIVIVGYYLFLASIDLRYLTSGIVIKAAILIGLISGFLMGIKAHNILKSNPYLASKMGYHQYNKNL